jgi:hypothetical protein
MAMNVGRWWKNGAATAIARSVASGETAPDIHGDPGEYQLLYKYLRDRYANRVVLTFGEIEDIVGFSLPESARLQQEWWVGTDALARRSAQSDSWTMASRTAVANLSAKSVVFDRTP